MGRSASRACKGAGEWLYKAMKNESASFSPDIVGLHGWKRQTAPAADLADGALDY